MTFNYTIAVKLQLSLIAFLFVSTTSTSLAQRIRLLADIEVFGAGLVNQEVTTGNSTNTESITGMGGPNIGINVGLPFRFESSLTVGSLLRYSASTTTYGSYGSSTFTTSFAVPKIGLEVARSFIWNENKVVSGLNFAIGLEHYWPQTFSASGDDGNLDINYHDAFGQYFRIKMVFRERRRFQLEPHITYRHFDLTASDYSQTNSSAPLHPSLQNLQVRNISFGVNFLFGFSDKEISE